MNHKKSEGFEGNSEGMNHEKKEESKDADKMRSSLISSQVFNDKKVI